jgi:hypothetical protein
MNYSIKLLWLCCVSRNGWKKKLIGFEICFSLLNNDASAHCRGFILRIEPLPFAKLQHHRTLLLPFSRVCKLWNITALNLMLFFFFFSLLFARIVSSFFLSSQAHKTLLNYNYFIIITIIMFFFFKKKEGKNYNEVRAH